MAIISSFSGGGGSCPERKHAQAQLLLQAAGAERDRQHVIDTCVHSVVGSLRVLQRQRDRTHTLLHHCALRQGGEEEEGKKRPQAMLHHRHILTKCALGWHGGEYLLWACNGT
jgi:hypothetical protein